MNQVVKVLMKVGQYVYRNSVWLIPIIETTFQTVKKYLKRKKNDRRIEEQNQSSVSETRQDC